MYASDILYSGIKKHNYLVYSVNPLCAVLSQNDPPGCG